ncbi:STAS domain-containing protein [Ferribacterium limneticum]|uniref:STAS domain-containing protein n=1 Tax=Ferribacterium limneticum TaxID=76259 RepID=UPI001CF8CE0C|nr:STAS domain-containing protein [Ferribacterium limneticum]UCV23186.1 anti-sigma factor antagonist [Ferribacterium limneticum]
MVFSFFKKQDQKMPERPAARPRAPDMLPEAKVPVAPAEDQAKPLPEPLPDLEFTPGKPTKPQPAPAARKPEGKPAAAQQPAAVDSDFSIDDFDSDDFTESSVMGIDVNHDDDPLQACVEQVVVLYANGQDGAARSLLETFVRSYHGREGRRFWLLLFDLLQATGERAAFEKLGADYAEACEMSPPTWSSESPTAKQAAGAVGPRKIFLQGVLTAEGALPVSELAKLIEQKAQVTVDCTKLIGCDDEVAGQLADLLSRARKTRLAVTLIGTDVFIDRLNSRMVAGDIAHEPSWRLLLELLQRHGTQDAFEERAVDYAVTFELSPPSWEPRVAVATPADSAATARPADDAHYLSGELKGCRFDELVAVIEGTEQPILDFSGVRRLDFVSAGQLVNRLAPYKAAGRDIVIRSPNHLVAELMAVVGLNKQARILVPKS